MNFRAWRVLSLFALMILCFVTKARAEGEGRNVVQNEAPTADEQTTFQLKNMRAFEGLAISSIEIVGLRWTRVQAARDLLSLHEGDTFNSDIWRVGLHKLYDTTVVYDVTTDGFLESWSGQNHVRIVVHLKDRWSLLPFAVAQAGGGSDTFGVGLVEFNFLGTFAQVSGSYGTFDGVSSYDFNVFQEFFQDTDLIWGVDLSQVGLPVRLQYNDGSTAGTYTRKRSQAQLLLGHKWTEKKIRLFSYFEFYKDETIGDATGSPVNFTNGNQLRLRPTLIFGRSELTNFLEQGQELTIAPSFANVLASSYSQLVVTYKKVFLHDNTNYALFLNAGAMTTAEVPYQFRLGGFDTVRGFSTNRAIGRMYAAGNFEYRPYLCRFTTELSGEVVFQADVFQDAAVMINANEFANAPTSARNLTLISDGIGLRANFLRFSGAIGRLDLAKAVVPNEGWDLSLGVGQFF